MRRCGYSISIARFSLALRSAATPIATARHRSSGGHFGLPLSSNCRQKRFVLEVRSLVLLEKHPVASPLTENEAGSYNHN
jgi:hypothetical protein